MHLDRLALVVHGTAQGDGQGLATPECRPSLPHALAESGVGGHPTAAQPHERALGLGESVDLLGRQRVALDRDFPAKVEETTRSIPAPTTAAAAVPTTTLIVGGSTVSSAGQGHRTRPRSMPRTAHRAGRSPPRRRGRWRWAGPLPAAGRGAAPRRAPPQRKKQVVLGVRAEESKHRIGCVHSSAASTTNDASELLCNWSTAGTIRPDRQAIRGAGPGGQRHHAGRQRWRSSPATRALALSRAMQAEFA